MGFEIGVREKFASWVFSRCDLRLPDSPPVAEVGGGLWVSTGDELPFKLDDWWRRQLGELVADNVEKEFSFCLTAKCPSENPRILDAETAVVERRVGFFAWGLVLSVGVPQFDLARIVSGWRDQGGFRLKLGTPEHFVRSGGFPRPVALTEDFFQAGRFAQRAESMAAERKADVQLYWRAFSGLDAFMTGVKSQLAHVKLHQFVRAIESFLLSKASGEKHFSEYSKTCVLRTKWSLGRCTDCGTCPSIIARLGMWSDPPRRPISDCGRRRYSAGSFSAVSSQTYLTFRFIFAISSSVKLLWEDTPFLERAWGAKLDLNLTA